MGFFIVGLIVGLFLFLRIVNPAGGGSGSSGAGGSIDSALLAGRLREREKEKEARKIEIFLTSFSSGAIRPARVVDQEHSTNKKK